MKRKAMADSRSMELRQRDTTKRVPGRLTAASALLTLAFVGLSGCGAGLSGSSTCSDYMNAIPAEQQQVVSSLAAEYHKGAWATPLGFPGVAYFCASNPNTTLDQFFQEASNY